MAKKKPFEQSTDELLRTNSKELSLKIKREIKSNFFFSWVIIRNDLVYGWEEGSEKKELTYYMDHKGFFEKDITTRNLAKVLYEDLSMVLNQGTRLKLEGINLRIDLNGMGLPHMGHGHYLSSGELDILSLPILLMDMKKRYGLY